MQTDNAANAETTNSVADQDAGIELQDVTYELTEKDVTYLNSAFVYHGPKDKQTERYKAIRAQAGALAQLILEEVPNSRERSLALTKTEEAMMWANAGIARNE